MSRLGEWISWGLHYLFGLAVGAGLGFALVYGRKRRLSSSATGLISEEVALPFIIGVSLFGAALGALYGDRLWMGDHYRVIAPDAPMQTPYTKLASYLSGAIGLGCIGYALYRQFSLR